jgi:hypothetical protein
LYGCETGSVILREELRVSENRLLRRIFGLERKMVCGWRKLRNEELHNMYTLPVIIRMKSRMRWAGHVTGLGRRECI